MTNGEKMQEVFPEGKTRKCRDGVVFESDGWCHAYDSDWWNAEYKELTTKNCESCRYYGSHHEVCNYCYECSLWTQGEPTTKNNLGVDREDAVERLSALKQLIGYDKDSEIVKATQKSLDMAIKALEQEPRKGHWIKTGDYYTGAYGSIEYVECSCCHEDSLEEGDFCPNCGADMR